MNDRLGREIFSTGAYIPYFNPDDRRNPFFKIYDRKRRDVAEILGRLEPGARILDLGAGAGRLAGSLSRSGKENMVLADLSLDMLNMAKAAGALGAVNADGHRLPFREASFDVVVGLDLFCHLERPTVALTEFRRVLKDEGSLILDSTSSGRLWPLFYPRYMGKNPVRWLKIIRLHGVYPGWEDIVRHYPGRVFFGLLRDHGFSVVKRLDYGPRICPKWHLVVARRMP